MTCDLTLPEADCVARITWYVTLARLHPRQQEWRGGSSQVISRHRSSYVTSPTAFSPTEIVLENPVASSHHNMFRGASAASLHLHRLKLGECSSSTDSLNVFETPVQVWGLGSSNVKCDFERVRRMSSFDELCGHTVLQSVPVYAVRTWHGG